MPDPIKIPVIGGVNRHAHVRRIPDGEVYTAKNVIGGDGILPQTRSGTSMVQMLPAAAFSPSAGGAIRVLQAWAPRTGAQDSFVAYLEDGYVIVVASDGGIDANNARFDLAYPAGAYGSAYQYTRPQAFELGTEMYIVSGGTARDGVTNGNLMFVDFSVSTPTVEAVTWDDAQTSPVQPRVACLYRGRAVYADFGVLAASGTSYEDCLIFSDPGLPLTIGVDALDVRAFTVGSRADGRIIAMTEVMQTSVGSPAQSALLVLREFAAYLVTGEPNWSTDTDQDPESIFGSMVVSKFNVNCGCASAETIARTPYGIVWAGQDQVWMMAEGAVPRPVGKKISSALLGGDPEWRPSWHAVYHKGYYRLAIASPEQDASLLGGSYDIGDYPMQHQWWLDLTSGDPGGEEQARWWGPMTYTSSGSHDYFRGTYCMLIQQPTGGAQRALGVGLADTAGRAFLFDLQPGTDPETDVIDSNGATGTPSSITVDITSEIVTREYEFGDPSTEKTFLASEAVLSSSVPADVVFTVGAEEAIAQPADPDVFEALPFSTLNVRVTARTLQFSLTTESGHTELAEWIAWVEVIPRRPSIV